MRPLICSFWRRASSERAFALARIHPRVLHGPDDLSPVTMRLTNEGYVVLHRKIQFTVEKGIAGPVPPKIQAARVEVTPG